MDMLNMSDNILAAYVKASDDDVREGMAWYADALALATELDPNNIRRAVGVIAVLSPLTSWPLNVRRAREVYATGTTSGLSRNVAKAERIFNGELPESVISGEKVTSFFHNILGDDVGVTIDRHAIDVAYGKVQNDTERNSAVKSTKARDGYAIIRDAYKHCANILTAEMGKTVTGAQLQAIVWVYWRREMAVAYHK